VRKMMLITSDAWLFRCFLSYCILFERLCLLLVMTFVRLTHVFVFQIVLTLQDITAPLRVSLHFQSMLFTGEGPLYV